MQGTKKTGARSFDDRARVIADLEQKFSAPALRRRRIERGTAAFWLLLVLNLGHAKRAFDLALSGLILVLLAPVFLAFQIRNARRGGTIVRTLRLGRWGSTFNQYSYASGVLRDFPALINVWKGDMSFIGPRPVSPGEVSSSDRLAWKRFDIRPGFFCLWWIRSRANIAYGSEVGADLEYIDSQTFLGDLGIALRAIPASLYGQGAALAPEQVNLLGIPINNLTMDEAVESLLQRATGTKPSQVCFVNADCANIACRDAKYEQILRGCGLVLADGIGVKLAGKILNQNIRQNVNGTDMLPQLCAALEREEIGVYLLGGKPGVAADVAKWMSKDFPCLPVRGYQHGYFPDRELNTVLWEIRASGAQVLLVAFGVPMQEKWIQDHLNETGAMLVMGVGGLFDFYSGRIPRAPVWMREIGMEWLFRFWQEPRRMCRRYFVGNLVFLGRVLRDRSRVPGYL